MERQAVAGGEIIVAIPPPPPGFVPESQFNSRSIPPPPPGFVPEDQASQFQPPTSMAQAFQRAFAINPQIEQTFSASRPGRILGAIGTAGSKLDELAQKTAGNIAEFGGRIGFPKTGSAIGTAIGTASEFALPKSKTEAAAQLGAIPFIGIGEASKEIGPLIKEGSKFIKPNAFDRLVGQAVSTTAAIPERYATAVAADTSILGDKTPTVREVGKLYQEAFKKAGMKVNSEELEKITGNPFPASDNELGKLQKIVLNAKNKLESGTLGENEAFLARSAAARIERSNAAAKNPAIRQVASGFKGAFDQLLIDSDLPNIKELSIKYFRAISKEYFQPLFPKNKNMSPNAVRSLLLLRQGVKAGTDLATGNLPGAALNAFKTATMSPRPAGKILQGLGAVRNIQTGVRTPLKVAIPPSLQRLMRKKVKGIQQVSQDAGPDS